MVTPTRDTVLAAQERLRGRVNTTALELSARLSDMYGRQVYLKREDTQPVRSYKLRGAFSFMLTLAPAQSGETTRVVCASAGNHGQGVAYAARQLGMHATIVVPGTTPRQKKERIVALGGDAVELIVAGAVFDDAAKYAAEYAQASGAVLIPPFDHELVIAGQGTIALEVEAQLPGDVGHAILLVPVGGGGLFAGALAACEGTNLEVVGIEAAGAPTMTAALAAGGPITLEHVDTFADGTAVRRAGDVTYEVVSSHYGQVVVVEEGAVATAMLELYQSEGIICEPSGALAVAGLAQLPAGGTPVVCVISGGNNDVSRYAEVIERSLVHRGLKHYFLVEFAQEPGALRRFLDEVLGPDDDITLFEYVKRSNKETGPALVGIELSRSEDFGALLKRIEISPLSIQRLEPGSTLHRFLV